MEQIYQLRELIIVFYKRHERILMPISKFFLAFFIFYRINHFLNYFKEISNPLIIFILSILSVIIPTQWWFLLLLFIIGTQLFFASLEAALLIVSLLLVIYLMYIRLFPKLSLLILAIPLCFYFKIPYVVPLFAGIFVGIHSIIPISIGVLIWYFSFEIPNLLEIQSGGDYLNIPDTLHRIYITGVGDITHNGLFIVTVIIFSLIIITVYIISRMEIDYAWYVAIAVGGIMNIAGFMVAMLVMNIRMSIIGLFLSTIVSVLLVVLAQFFYRVVDYSRSEKVQFEDDENYYYVKVVPKIMIERPKREIRRIIQGK
ncbi:MAG: hypothetical protein GX238_10440 [Epulopiscium sp.]|nr:hypothetical protein [Candidatus Epulonipiscium sp.]